MTKAALSMTFAALAFSAVCPFSLQKARAEELQLDSVIRAALDHGQKVPQADIKLKLAEAKLQQAEGAFDWRASARAGWSRLYFPRVETVDNTRVLTDSLDNSWAEQVTTGVSRLFRSGIQIQPGITFYPGTNVSQAQTFGLTRPQPTLNMQVPLLHVFDGNNPAATDERAAFDEVVGTKFERGAAQQEAVLDAVQTYWRCLAAQEEVKILEADQASSQSYLNSLRKLMAAGQIEPSVMDRAQAKQASKDGDLDKIHELKGACSADLGVLMGENTDMALPTIAKAFPNLDALSAMAGTLNEETLVNIAFKNRPDMQALEQYVAAANERLAGARTGLDPKVDLSVDPTGVFLTVSKSLEGNAEEGLVAGAEANASEARLNLTELQDQIRRDIARGISALRDSLNTLLAQRQSDQALMGVVEDARRGTKLGAMASDDLRTLESERADTEVQLTEAELDSALNLAALRLATGTVAVDDATAPAQNADRFRSLQFQ